MTSTPSATEPSPRKTYRVMAIVAVLIIGLMGVAIYSLSRLETKPWSSMLSDPTIESTFRKDLPHFEHSAGEKTLTPRVLEGKWTLLTFWSYTCPPCLVELPGMDLLMQSWTGPEFQILTVNVDEPKSEALDLARNFLIDSDISLPTYYDLKGELKVAFGVDAYPRHFLINPEKQIVWEALGAYNWEGSARDQLLKLIEQQTPETVEDPAE